VGDFEFDVVGVPAPQGSKSAFVIGKRAVIVDGSSKVGREKHKTWRSCVTEAAMEARDDHEFTGPVSVQVRFFLPLPSSDPHRSIHSTKPDLDKLLRSVLDSLTASGLIRDDSLVWDVLTSKVYARDGHWTGATITVNDSGEQEANLREGSKLAAKEARKNAKVIQTRS
jgi:Holliday junction resolvase RusA-like endonuclease